MISNAREAAIVAATIAAQCSNDTPATTEDLKLVIVDLAHTLEGLAGIVEDLAAGAIELENNARAHAHMHALHEGAHQP